MSSDKLTWTLTGATVAGVLAVYVPCAPRTVPGGDSGTISRVFVFTSHAAYHSEAYCTITPTI